MCKRARASRESSVRAAIVYSARVNRSSFAGYTYEHASRSDFYGDIHGASKSDGSVVDLLKLDPQLASVSGFAAALSTHGLSLARLEHPHVVRTLRVGKLRDGSFCVVTETLDQPITLADLLRASPGGLPRPIATVLGEQILQGVAKAHELNIMHGALHPRSVAIDAANVARVQHWAVGRALAISITRDPGLRDAVEGYGAPELGRGRITARSADVYAAAALIYAMLTGRPPPGTLDISPAFERMIQRALDTAMARRYPHAGQFLGDYVEAVEDDRWPRATAAELAAFMDEMRVAIRELPDEDEDPDAPFPFDDDDDDGEASTEYQVPTRVGSDPVADDFERDPISELIHLSTLDMKLAAAEARESGPDDDSAAPATAHLLTSAATPMTMGRGKSGPLRAPVGKNTAENAALAAIDSLALDADEDDDEAGISSPAIAAPPAPADTEAAALAALDGLLGAVTGSSPVVGDAAVLEPEPPPSRARSRRTSSQDATTMQAPSLRSSASFDDLPRPATAPPARMETPAPDVAAGSPRPPSAAPPASYSAEMSMPAEPAAPAPPVAPAQPVAPALDDLERLVEPDIRLGGSSGLVRFLWVIIALGALAALVWVIRHQMQLREQAEEQKARQEAENRAVLEDFRQSAPKSGQVLIESQPDGAAVWMLLGRTPMETQPMATDMAHQMRIEYPAHVTEDVTVTGDHWTGADNAKKATVRLVMEQGEDSKLPAAPPEPTADEKRGLGAGMGRIEIDTEPSGAQVWLLVGFTPGTQVSGQANVEYTFKVHKDGYIPGVIDIKGKDWDSATGDTLERNIKLERRKPRGK